MIKNKNGIYLICEGCKKEYKFTTKDIDYYLNNDALPEGWIKSESNKVMVVGSMSMCTIHDYCENCFNIKDILE